MARRRTRRARLVAAAVVVMAATSCTSSDDGDEADPTERSGAPDGAWRVDMLGPVAESRGGTSVVAGDRVVVLAPTPAGALEPWTSVDGGPFASGSPSPRGSDGLFVPAAATAPAPATGRAIAVGIDLRTFAPLVFLPEGTSGQDEAWEEAAITGMDAPADPSAVATTAEGFVVVGIRREGPDPIGGPFRPTAWSSPDGRSWTESALPGGGDGFASGVAVVDGGAGEEVLAVGRAAGADALWRSGDGGVTWERAAIEVEGVGRPTALVDVAADGDVVVAIGQPADDSPPFDSLVLRSEDGGRRWETVDLGDVTRGGQAALSLDAGPAGFSIVTNGPLEPSDAVDLCYVDLDACTGTRPLVLRSATGESWDELDLGSAPGLSSVDRAHETASGDVVVVGVDGAGTRSVWTWPAEAGPVPTTDPSPSPTPAEPLVAIRDDLDSGVTYRFPLPLHCGMDYLGQLDGSHWYLDDAGPTSPPTGSVEPLPDHWPVAENTVYGYVTLTADDTIDYSIATDEVIGVYHRSDAEPPDCR